MIHSSILSIHIELLPTYIGDSLKHNILTQRVIQYTEKELPVIPVATSIAILMESHAFNTQTSNTQKGM